MNKQSRDVIIRALAFYKKSIQREVAIAAEFYSASDGRIGRFDLIDQTAHSIEDSVDRALAEIAVAQ